MDGHVNNLQIVQWNAHSLTANISDFLNILITTKPDIVAIQETWLKSDTKITSVSSYDFIRKERTNKNCGGLLLAIRKDLIYHEKTITEFPNGILEVQVITVKENMNNIDIMNIYNPNTNKLKEWTDCNVSL